MNRVIKRASAKQDLKGQAAFIGKESPHSAQRFLEAAEKAFDLLSSMPEMGSKWESKNPRFSRLRVWPIRGFEKNLIFYFPIENGIEVIRVLYGMRDLESIFGT